MNLFYITDIFPVISQVFISRELAVLESLGANITMLSLQKPKDDIAHALNRQLLTRCFWGPDLGSGKIVKGGAHFWAMFSNPKAYRATWTRSRTAGLPSMQYLFRQLPLYCRLIREAGAQRIHCHFGWQGMLVGWLANSMLGLPFSVTLHGSDIQVSPYENLGVVLNDADLVVCVSEKIKTIVELKYNIDPNKLAVIPCGIPIADYSLPLEKHKESLNILCVARLHPVKGLTDLITACSILRDRGIKFKCSIVGDGEQRQSLQAQVEALGLNPFVYFLGAMPNEKLPQVYSESSLFVLPSHSEGMPVVLMEAMASGLPVVATNVGGIPELVEDGENGFLVAPGQPEQIADAIQRILGQTKMDIDTMGKNSRHKVETYFNSQTEAGRLFDLFKTLAVSLKEPSKYE